MWEINTIKYKKDLPWLHNYQIRILLEDSRFNSRFKCIYSDTNVQVHKSGQGDSH